MFQTLMVLVLGQAPAQPERVQPPVTMLVGQTPTASPSPSPGLQPMDDPIAGMRQDGLSGTCLEPRRTDTIVGTPYPLKATGGEEAFSGSVTLNQDVFFGFYPILNGSYAINDRFALTFYGLFWTNPALTPSGTGGSGLWTELGVGVSFALFDKLVTVNPAIGYLNGTLLSGASRPRPFDGIVSQVSFSHAGTYTEGQLYFAYYAATSAPSNNDFLHWWTTAGLRPFANRDNVTQILSFGVHFEQLYQTKARISSTSNIYTWLGPYVQVTLPNNVFLRVNAGWDLQDNISGSFYKASMGFVF